MMLVARYKLLLNSSKRKLMRSLLWRDQLIAARRSFNLALKRSVYSESEDVGGWNKMDINELLALANQGDRGAQRVLEKTLGQPEGMYTQMVEATQKSIEGAKLGDVASMRYLGQAYYMGLGIEKNFDLAKLWFERAVEKNDSTAMFHLGQMYAAVYDEYDKAEDLINKAVKIGPIVGVTQDEIDHTLEAIALFAKTAKRG